MFPADFRYTRADSVTHALDLLDSARADGDDVKVIAGGQSLLPMMKLRLATPAALLDIGDLTDLKGVTRHGDHVSVGALATYRDLQRDPRVAAAFPAIADALGVLADPQVRARGTIGGAVAHGDPAADLPAVLLALGARVTIASRARTRSVALDDFLLGVFSTDLAADELITAVTIPAAPAGRGQDGPPAASRRTGQAYEKFAQPASHLPLAGACAIIEVSDGALASARIAVTGIAPRPFRAHIAERELRSRSVPALLAQLSGSGSPGTTGLASSTELDAMLAGAIARSLAGVGTEPLADQHASGPFRVHLAGVMARRALARALSRAEAQAGADHGCHSALRRVAHDVASRSGDPARDPGLADSTAGGTRGEASGSERGFERPGDPRWAPAVSRGPAGEPGVTASSPAGRGAGGLACTPQGAWLGTAVVRREDPALLTGRGQFIDDIDPGARDDRPRVGQASGGTGGCSARPPGDLLHAFVVRSPVAHARIVSLDVSGARAAEGVAAVLTAADLDAAGIGPMPGGEGLPAGALNPPFPVLASGKVVWAGQPVALIVASTAALAADAAELVDVTYDELPAVTAPLDAAAPGAPVLHARYDREAIGHAPGGTGGRPPGEQPHARYDREAIGHAPGGTGGRPPGEQPHEGSAGNVSFRARLAAGDADAAFARAAHRVAQRMRSQRVAPVALEPRGVLAWVSGDLTGDDGRLEVRLPTQRPHGSRRWLSGVLGLPLERIHVVAGDVGGAFGAKGPIYPDQVAVIFAAIALRRPVKWIEERGESFLATTHGRDQVADLEMAVDADGRITALRGVVHASFGAYFTPNAPASLLGRLGPMLPQGYRIASIDVELVGVLANTPPIGPYRGAGRPESAYFCERLVDLAAAATGLDPAELRRRNFIAPGEFPYATCTGLVYDSGDYQAGLEEMLARLDRASLEAERVRLAAATGELLGVGIASFVEPGGITPGAGPAGGSADAGDRATVTVSASGAVTVAVGTSGHGQGHETAFAQLAADLLGVPYEDVTVVFGDTDKAPFGYGTFGSRSAVAGGTAIYRACQAVLDAAKRVDAPLPVARAAARLGGLSATAASGAPPETYASGSYGCVVAVDPATGRVRVLRVVAVDDCGVVINPLLVEGQVHGAIAQGLGQALLEEVAYDSCGQPLAASLMDYAVPFAESMPPVLESYLVCTPSPANPLGVKGMGESGTIGITPALVSAVMDALRGYGIAHLDMPLTAEKVWTAIQSAR